MVTGVLVVLIGAATAAADRQPDHDKTYEGTLRLGVATDTGDLTGTVLRTAPVTAGEAELRAVLPRFTGPISQLPPMYSAVKVNGQPLYKAARQGRTVERTPRTVTSMPSTISAAPPPATTRCACAAPKALTSARCLRTSARRWACPRPWSRCAVPRPGRTRWTSATRCPDILAAAENGTLAENGWVLGVDTAFAALPALTVGETARTHLFKRLPHQPLPRGGRPLPRL